MRFILQLLKNKCLLIHVKGQSISCLKNIPRQKKEIQKHIKQLKKIMQPYFKNIQLMNDSNFGYDCRNNLHDCQFVPIFHELQEITYLKRHYNYFDSKVSSFVSSNLLR